MEFDQRHKQTLFLANILCWFCGILLLGQGTKVDTVC